MSKNILLTGKPGVGKTTLIKKATERFKGELGGFYTEEIRSGGHRKGFKIKVFEGKEGVLAHVEIRSSLRVGKYKVNKKALEEVAVPALKNAIAEKKIIIVDELGRMELCSDKFQKAVMEVLEIPKPLLGVIQKRRNAFLDKIRSREDVEIVEVNYQNRDALLEGLKEKLLSL